jgi:hypothetical protein
MAAVGDLVELPDGSVGVIGAELASPPDNQFRVYFPDSYKDITASDIQNTLSAPSYQVGDEVTVWPELGTITAVDGSEYTVAVEMSKRIEGVGHITWTGVQVVPFWRLVRDNDSRIERVY